MHLKEVRLTMKNIERKIIEKRPKNVGLLRQGKTK
jgi:hypothetical protein